MKLLTVFCLLVFVNRASAATINADSPSRDDVATAVTASSNDDTVAIPAGTATWTSSLTISKGITLQGAGVGQTIIKDGIAGSTPFLVWDMPSSLTCRLAHITFTNGGRTDQAFSGNIQINGQTATNNTARMVVELCEFRELFGVAIQAVNVIGVFSSNRYSGVPTSRFVNVFNLGWDGGVYGDRSYTDVNRFGTELFLFIEGNTFSYPIDNYAFSDSWMGSRYVVRYNSFTNGWVEAHGTDSGNRYRGTRAVEAYMNVFTGNDSGAYVMNFRSGVVLCWSNTASGYTASPRFELAAYRVNEGTWVPWGQADGSNQWDTNNTGVLQEALDQPGRSGGSLITGDTPVLPWTAGENNQVDDPCYEWANTEDGGNLTWEIGQSCIRTQEHYYAELAMPGYTPFTFPHPLVSGSATRNLNVGTMRAGTFNAR